MDSNEMPGFVCATAESSLVTTTGNGQISVVSRAQAWIRDRWVPFRSEVLEQAEEKLLGPAVLLELRSFVRQQYVPVLNGTCRLWTTVVSSRSPGDDYSSRTPLVLLHGLGGGGALWMRNFDALAAHRVVYAIDVLGFGRSSRPSFGNDDILAEQQWVQSLEDWRRYVKLDKITLLGHSLGAYIASAYALEHPDFVNHLILADPWGFPAKPVDQETALSTTLPTWIRIVSRLFSQLSPLYVLRVAGPFGPSLIRRIRPDIGKKFFDDSERQQLIFDYIYHCNAQLPSGEDAFQLISIPFAWAKRPMVDRLPLIRRNFPITFIYGSRSWTDPDAGYLVQKQLRHRCPVRVEIMRNSGHHVYTDQADSFNELINEALAFTP
ncbi:Abhydrolase 6 domain containing protein [Trichuris trichiura]|uniref:Abhydrolase 6 domain containing protein n=1 Tax=Trichuris trichiura TaxID=36087 RepID=A0A077Z1P6_TRITR|nr:Abhydrolase 6 domain containing protein [Trichuris trichiura]